MADEKLLHAGGVLAQYLDNDEDGVPDNGVAANLAKRGATLLMFSTQADREELMTDEFQDRFRRAGHEILQDLYGSETHPGKLSQPWDGALEEVLHLVTHGYVKLWPETFGIRRSALTRAMDKARGGRFRRVPRRYPTGAWYTYSDRSCNYYCQVFEYFYWVLSSILGAQKNPTRVK